MRVNPEQVYNAAAANAAATGAVVAGASVPPLEPSAPPLTPPTQPLALLPTLPGAPPTLGPMVDAGAAVTHLRDKSEDNDSQQRMERMKKRLEEA